MKINICVFSENSALFINKCLYSLLNQNYKDFDILVYDNGSTDNTASVLSSFADKVKIVFAPHQDKDKALCNCFNSSIESADGVFWFKIGGEEYVQPDYLENCIKVAREIPEADWIYSGIKLVNIFGADQGYWDYSAWPIESRSILQKGWNTASIPLPIHGIVKLEFLRKNKITWKTFDNGKPAVSAL